MNDTEAAVKGTIIDQARVWGWGGPKHDDDIERIPKDDDYEADCYVTTFRVALVNDRLGNFVHTFEAYIDAETVEEVATRMTELNAHLFRGDGVRYPDDGDEGRAGEER